MARRTNGSFTAAGQNSAVVLGRQAEAILTGAFTATVVAEVQDANGNWAPVDGVALSAPAARKFEMAVSRPWRLTVTSFTSGPVTYELAGEEFPNQV